jgi:hypothetical protein
MAVKQRARRATHGGRSGPQGTTLGTVVNTLTRYECSERRP